MAGVLIYIYILRVSRLTWPMAKLSTFWDYIFSRENKPFKRLFFRVQDG